MTTQKPKRLEQDRQVKEVRVEIEHYAKRIGELKQLDTNRPEVKGTMDFLELMLKLRKEALDKLGLSYEIPEGQRRVLFQ